VGGHVKRACDVIIAALAIVAAAPVMLLLAGMVAWNGGAPIYAHERVGFAGRRFKCLKFRTMRRDGDQILKELLDRDPAVRSAWNTHRKLKDDPRITPLGHFLRKSSLDELPQLFNVLVGDMSFVGPRPVTEDELEYYRGHVDDYVSARPGLTGVWQISGRSNVSMERRVQMDVDYLRTWSLANDASIILRTPVELIRSKGSY
jgi:lipopolysaccharide/colanic/teichoic acid biosynthesis glycosyltransferase